VVLGVVVANRSGDHSTRTRTLRPPSRAVSALSRSGSSKVISARSGPSSHRWRPVALPKSDDCSITPVGGTFE
jgi:hypothetical protein